ncbi:hypothetical protein LTR84_001458 [Exophiala bonariae]|uniref:UDP-N-acetylglucosamine transferase subunit ALG14 n=1 Tax=Exophiala bonariae TaxID=1690606 RepID=A0AAV9NDJ9_9EURO|nr:hypothetical protein LTR84_001458 [Exophiala bonariae]
MDSQFRRTTSPPLDPSGPSFFSIPNTSNLTPFQKVLLISLAVSFLAINFTFYRLASILSRESRKSGSIGQSAATPTGQFAHLLVVLGSGGHTAEMLNILSTSLPSLQAPWTFNFRTYVISSGDSFSAQRAQEFESALAERSAAVQEESVPSYSIITVHRARKVHQSLFTAPLSSLRCLWDCLRVLIGSHPNIIQTGTSVRGTPDLILTNGPGTGVIVILASLILLFFGLGGTSTSSPSMNESKTLAQDAAQSGQMRSIYIESWARVKTLSLSGRLLKPLVDRFIVQWPQLVETEGKRVEYIGPLVT